MHGRNLVSGFTLFALLVGVLFCLSISPLLVRYVLVKYTFNNFNFSEILCQVGNNISSVVTESCKTTLEEALYNYREYRLPILIHSDVDDLPNDFDARKEWVQCPSVHEIKDQGACGSCWAVAVASTIEDRLCIHSSGRIKTSISAQDVLSCCHKCGSGCNGGNPFNAWKYWKKYGIVTGGSYGEVKGCKPYTIPPCIHFDSANCTHFQKTPLCEKVCRRKYEKTYEADLHFGQVVYSIISDEKQIMKEIMSNGPVQTQMALYDDLVKHSSGIYNPLAGSRPISQHSLKITGWGTDKTTSVNYWLSANSFNRYWGENGFLRIQRGDTCNFETNIHAGIPRLS